MKIIRSTIIIIASVYAPSVEAAEFYYVPSKETAIEEAAALLKPLIGAERLARSLPLNASLEGNIWEVYGTPNNQKNRKSGIAEPQWVLKIDRKTGAVVGFGVGI